MYVQSMYVLWESVVRTYPNYRRRESTIISSGEKNVEENMRDANPNDTKQIPT